MNKHQYVQCMECFKWTDTPQKGWEPVQISISKPVVISSLIKTLENIMKERAAGFTADVMSISPLPVLFQVIFVLQDLTRGQKHVTG